MNHEWRWIMKNVEYDWKKTSVYRDDEFYHQTSSKWHVRIGSFITRTRRVNAINPGDHARDRRYQHTHVVVGIVGIGSKPPSAESTNGCAQASLYTVELILEQGLRRSSESSSLDVAAVKVCTILCRRNQTPNEWFSARGMLLYRIGSRTGTGSTGGRTLKAVEHGSQNGEYVCEMPEKWCYCGW